MYMDLVVHACPKKIIVYVLIGRIFFQLRYHQTIYLVIFQNQSIIFCFILSLLNKATSSKCPPVQWNRRNSKEKRKWIHSHRKLNSCRKKCSLGCFAATTSFQLYFGLTNPFFQNWNRMWLIYCVHIYKCTWKCVYMEWAFRFGGGNGRGGGADACCCIHPVQ